MARSSRRTRIADLRRKLAEDGEPLVIGRKQFRPRRSAEDGSGSATLPEDTSSPAEGEKAAPAATAGLWEHTCPHCRARVPCVSRS
jgi:hypothetical protein